MDILRLFIGLMMLTVVILATVFVMHADSWRSAVSALHLRWEREQRQAAPNGVSLAQRQAVQASFEQLVANRPMRMMWLNVFVGVAAAALSLLLAWNLDDLRWIGLWLVAPIGVAILAVLGYGWMLINQANSKLAATSASLYGPAPPRVKVSSIRTNGADT